MNKCFTVLDLSNNEYVFKQIGKRFILEKDNKVCIDSHFIKFDENEEFMLQIIGENIVIRNQENFYESHAFDGTEKIFGKNNQTLEVNFKTISFFDAQKNFYEFNQVGKKIFIKKDDKIIFESTLLKLKEVEEYPVRPIIINDKLYVFNYDKGFEIHYLDGSNKKFFNTRAIYKITFAKSRLFLQKQTKLVTFDTEKEEIEDIKSISESVDINPINENYLLFYLLKYNKSYLYNVETKEYLELPTFFAKFGIITKTLMQDNKLIIFYYGRELENPCGVYVYDLKKQEGNFSYALSKFKNSANCHKYLSILNFSFNDNENIPANLEQDNDYIKYLYLILKKFGFFAFLYYSSNERLEKLEDTSVCREVKNVIKDFTEKMSKYPKSNKEFENIIAEMILAEERLKAIKL